jgi:hypothetical protein
MKLEVIGAILMVGGVAGLGIGGLLRLLSRWLPGKPDPTTLTMDAVRQVYRRSWAVGLFVYGFAFVVAVVGSLVLWQVLLWLHVTYLATLPPSRFLVPDEPDRVMWLVVSVICSLGLGLMSSIRLAPVFFPRERLERFWRASSALDRFDSRWVLIYLGLCCATLPLAGSIFLAKWYYRFDERGIVSNDLFSVGERFHPYEDITRVAQVERYRRSNGDIVIRPFYRIDFRDGSHWTSYDHMLMVDEFVPLTTFAPLIDFVCEKTGKPLEQADFLKDVPGS